ncbi:TIGR03089 family protein [Rhodococcoides trifolii]|uniref:TIGR03089 family protein n=1 Tax=Rhodococcoides trifolii TaxID=908250 RepID=A0A917FWY5_9NOCA|nr:TIGR03089 family protein [Rhodococcus trifolii]GGG12741.1 TIGR03089 family protein [Rhodococcus trifolii]
MPGPTLTETLLQPILDSDPAGPRITYYDDATSERIELSAVTLANWAAKTANFLRDDFGFAPGGVVAVALPAHWQTAAVLLGAWWAGADVVLDATAPSDVALVTAEGVESAQADEVVAFSLDAFGKAVPDLPIGVTDYATSVRVHGDQFVPSGAGHAVLDGRAVDDVLAAARARAAQRGFTATDRVLSSAAWSTADDLVDGLLSVLVVGASLVQVSNPNSTSAERRIATEKVTAVLDG